jgi:hypothetical protein
MGVRSLMSCVSLLGAGCITARFPTRESFAAGAQTFRQSRIIAKRQRIVDAASGLPRDYESDPDKRRTAKQSRYDPHPDSHVSAGRQRGLKVTGRAGATRPAVARTNRGNARSTILKETGARGAEALALAEGVLPTRATAGRLRGPAGANHYAASGSSSASASSNVSQRTTFCS